MVLVYDEVCPMCRMGLIHGLEEHTFYGGEVSFDFEFRPTKHAPDVVESAASVSISTASEVSASEAESTPATTQVM